MKLAYVKAMLGVKTHMNNIQLIYTVFQKSDDTLILWKVCENEPILVMLVRRIPKKCNIKWL